MMFRFTLWLCAYLPVKMEDLEGQQLGVVAYAWVYRVPPRANTRRVVGSACMVPDSRWSSVRMMRMFGGSSRPVVAWGRDVDSAPTVTGNDRASAMAQTRSKGLLGTLSTFQGRGRGLSPYQMVFGPSPVRLQSTSSIPSRSSRSRWPWRRLRRNRFSSSSLPRRLRSAPVSFRARRVCVSASPMIRRA